MRQRLTRRTPLAAAVNRPYVGPDGAAREPRAREGFKVEFDERVFGSRYF